MKLNFTFEIFVLMISRKKSEVTWSIRKKSNNLHDFQPLNAIHTKF